MIQATTTLTRAACHRVIRKTGAFGEYHWGTTRKQALLAWEAARTAGEPEELEEPA